MTIGNTTKRNKGGFTLIELLVVIAIIGILSSIVVVSLSSARARSRDSSRIAAMKQMQIALELYYDEFGTYPKEAGSGNKARYENAMGELVSKGYLPSVPKDPLGGDVTYYYVATIASGTKCRSYHLGVNLETVSGDSSYLAEDSDSTSTTGGGSCDVEGGSNFNGAVGKCLDTAGAVEDKCYDLTP